MIIKYSEAKIKEVYENKKDATEKLKKDANVEEKKEPKTEEKKTESN